MMRLAALLFASMALASCSAEQDAFAAIAPDETAEPAQSAKVESIASDELAALVQSGEVVLIDVRSPEEFAQGRLPGALNAPLETFDPASIPFDSERETILYCRTGNRSAQAAQMLAEHTQDTIRHLDGGITAWQDAGGTIIAAPAS